AGGFGLAQLEPELEEAAQLLAGHPRRFASRPARDHAHDPHRLVTGAVAAGVALGLAQGSETSHDRTLGSSPDGKAPPPAATIRPWPRPRRSSRTRSRRTR